MKIKKEVKNSIKGIVKQIVEKITEPENTFVVCEASGGYDRPGTKLMTLWYDDASNSCC